MSKSSITISPRFFATELRNYSCHRGAVVREFLQNSVDSLGCTKIEFEYGEDWLSVKDNGTGMDRRTLIEKFLTIGATGKEGSDQIGGMGKAKTLLCFSQESYEIKSHDYILKGVGGDYSLDDNEFTRGCEFKIQTKETNWEHYIKSVLSKSNIRQTVTINGEVYKSQISRGRWARSLSFGEVWVNKSQTAQVIVRSGGVWMYDAYSSAPSQVIIEITPEISREVLLSNRDSLNYKYQRELESFLSEVASESLSALKTKTKKFTQFANPGKVIFSKRKQTKQSADFNEAKFLIEREQVAALIASPEPKVVSDGFPLNPDYRDTAVRSNWYDPAMISLESDNPVLVRAAKFFDLSYIDESTTRIKLLKVWKSILQFVTEKYTERTGHEFAWGFGFVFSEDAAAQCKSVGDGSSYYLLLNPVGEDGKIKYSINNKEDLSILISYAIHEVSHIQSLNHNEIFAQCQTFTLVDVLKEINELFRQIKENK